MNIYVSDELGTIKRQLVDSGYTLVNNNFSEKCDAIIIDLKKEGIRGINPQNINMDGTLIIDSGARKFEEIERILNRRL